MSKQHVEGDTLYYHCEYTKTVVRSGVVVQVVPYLGIHYILEVETNCPLGASFHMLESEFQVWTEDQR